MERKKTKPSVCGNCEARTGVKWKCKDCDKLLCVTCKDKHQRAKATQKHVIIERQLKKKGKTPTPPQDPFEGENENGFDADDDDVDGVTYAFCKKHTNMLSQWFCNSCCVQVCRTCVSIDHESHVIAEIASQLKKRESKLQKYYDYVEPYLNDALERRKGVKCSRVDFDNNVVTMKREIWLRYDEFMMHLGNQRDEMLKQLDEIQRTEEVKFVRATETIEKEVTSLESVVNSLRDSIEEVQSGRLDEGVDVKSVVKKIQRRELPNPPKLSFKTSVLTNSAISNMYGKLESRVLKSPAKPKPIDTHSPMSTPEMEITVMASFGTKLPFVKSLCPISDTEAWIACWQCDETQRVSERGKLETIKLSAMDMARTDDGDVMIAVYSQCSIQRLRSDGVMCEFKSTAPLYPTGIFVSKSGDIYVNLVDRYDLQVEESSVRRLEKLDKSGNTRLTVECDGRDVRMFTYPAKVTLNVNDDICVVDETGQYTGRLVVLDHHGDVKFIYGENDATSGEKCDLSSCACDENGRIFITDWLHHKIHIVSKEGYFMGFLMTKEDGIYFPFSLAFVSDGSMWIGCKLSGESEHGDIVRVKFQL